VKFRAERRPSAGLNFARVRTVLSGVVRLLSWSRSLLLGAALACVAAHAGAEPTSAPATAEDASVDAGRVARARALFDEGVAAYAQGHYYDAIERFTETARLYPNQQLAFNIAKAYDNLGNRPAALRYYREYLRSSADPPDTIVNTRVEELEHALAERGIQQLSVLSTPPGATVVLDGEPVGLTPWTGESWPGTHRVELRRSGYAPKETVIELDAHRSADLKVELVRAEAKTAHRSSDTSNDPLAARVRVVTWTALAAATTALGTAVVIEVADQRENRGIAPVSAFFAGLGTAAAGVGGVMLYLDLSASGAIDRGVSVDAGPSGASASYRTTF
jgi:tetratricopeptide (TPR) repeat protein